MLIFNILDLFHNFAMQRYGGGYAAFLRTSNYFSTFGENLYTSAYAGQ